MRKVLFIFLSMMLSVSVMAQQKIQLRSADRAECTRSDMTSLQASFSFSTIEVQDIQSERGTFSWLSLPNTVIGGNEGGPQIPAVSELIAVPFGANPSIRVTSYSTTDYDLEEYGIHRLMPRQPNVWKNQRPEDVPFVYNEAAYQTRGLSSEPMVRVSIDGIMRGVQVGRMSIEPVSYDPVNNKIRVFNDIEVEVSFNGADARATEDMLVKTYSPYFDVLYKQLFNGRAVRDVYEDHPDLWKAPVKMLVIANRMFENCIQDWLAWKTMKGIYVDVNYTDVIGTSTDAIKSFIQNKYAQDAPTFLVIMGDKDQVAPSIASASETSCVADLYYSSVDGDEFVDMYHSRMSAETTAQMTALINKCLEYEQFTMPDPSYLNNALLIAGEDSGYGITVGRPTIWYASNYYYNTAHGFNNVYEFSQGTYTNCYAPLSSGVGFANYTAHGSKTSWAGPSFTVSDVENLTNEHKYFLAIGNCCQSGDWGYSTTCFGEALTRAENKGAYAYIGSCPNTTWYNDYYFGVGATTVNTNISAGQTGTMPTTEQTTMGIYDAIWMDDAYNTVNSILYTGLLAGNAAEALGYQMHSATLYYWQAYHVIGDGSIMPYRVQPTANNVSHMAILPIGMPTYEVSTVPGSYVAISKDGVLLGAALVDATGTVQVPITPVTSGGDVTICVTAPNRIPYVTTVPAAALEGPYLVVDSYTPTTALVGENTNLSLTFKNVGTAATTGSTTVTLTCDDPNVVVSGTGSFGALNAEATTTVSGFRFLFNSGVALGSSVAIHYTAVNGSDTYEGNINITPDQIFTVTVAANNADYGTVTGGGEFHYGQSCTVSATPADGYMFTSWAVNGSLVSTNATYTFTVTDNTNVVASFGEGVIIGEGTATKDELPSYSYYTNSLTEQIYTSAELGGAGLITSIAFYNAGAEKDQDYDIYMKSTTKSSFSSKTDWIAVSAADKVFSGKVTMVANDWITITFSIPFVYDGTSNVVLVTDKSTQWTSSPHMSCRVFTTSSNQAIYAYDDNYNFDPTSPDSSSAHSNDMLSVKNQIIVTKSSLDGCLNVAPSSVVVGDITGNTANVTWTGYSESYNVCLGVGNITTYANADFTESIPSGWSNDSDYPWTVVDGHMQSGNAGVNSSMSTISATVAYLGDGTIEFDAECMGEGTSYDKCIFLIDGVQQFSYGANVSGWNHYNYNVSAGEHTFTWTYSKDVSVHPTGDYFAVDNVVMVSNQIEWNSPFPVEDAEYTLRGLTPETSYCVRVQGVCDGVESGWSEIVMFNTDESLTIDQTVTLPAGWAWWSSYLDITLEQLEAALGNAGIVISSQNDGFIGNYSGTWTGALESITLSKMYKIQMAEEATITLNGMPVNPADYLITLNEGPNWIGYPVNQSMSLDEAFAGANPVNGDMVSTFNGSSMYYNGAWYGNIQTLEPGQGYIYESKATGTKTFTYPTR